jgi:hypothetical protein
VGGIVKSRSSDQAVVVELHDDNALVVYTDGSCLRVPEIAEKMAIKQNFLYGVLPGLAEDGLVEKDDQARAGRARHLRTHNLGGRVPELDVCARKPVPQRNAKACATHAPTPPARPTAER